MEPLECAEAMCMTPSCPYLRHAKSSVSRGHCCKNCGKWCNNVLVPWSDVCPHGTLCQRRLPTHVRALQDTPQARVVETVVRCGDSNVFGVRRKSAQAVEDGDIKATSAEAIEGGGIKATAPPAPIAQQGGHTLYGIRRNRLGLSADRKVRAVVVAVE